MKNPFMSIFLSQANRVAGTVRRSSTATVKREATKNTKQLTSAWTNAFFAVPPASKKKRTRRK